MTAPGVATAQSAPARSVATTASPIAWSGLTAAQARTLAPLAQAWPTLDGDQQRQWLELANRYPGLSSADQQLMRERMAQWAAMPPSERRRARVQFQRASALSPEQRQTQWEAYQALPPEERKRLADQAQQRAATAKAQRPTTGSKPTLVEVRPTVAERPVAPATVRAAPGASTRPVTRVVEPPRHQQAGLPKIAATPEFVDPVTLLPRRGAQAAGVRDPVTAAAAAGAAAALVPPASHADAPAAPASPATE